MPYTLSDFEELDHYFSNKTKTKKELFRRLLIKFIIGIIIVIIIYNYVL